MSLNMQHNNETQIAPPKSVKNRSNSEKDKYKKQQLEREESKKSKFHKIFMWFVNITCWSVFGFYIFFFIVWILRCIAMTNSWKNCVIQMFNDMTFVGSYLMTAIISIFITHIIDKKIN